MDGTPWGVVSRTLPGLDRLTKAVAKAGVLWSRKRCSTGDEMRRLSILFLSGVLLGLLGLFAVPAVASAEESALPSTCGTFVAHRGEHSRWTENTLRAMTSAARVGADYVEVDVRETSDSGLVLMHDRTIDRTTTSSG